MLRLLHGEDAEHLVAEGAGDLSIGAEGEFTAENGIHTTGILLGRGALAAGHGLGLVGGHGRR